MFLFERLPGLPGTGPLPEQFSATGSGTHREGLVVRFSPASGSAWVGNFQPGLSDYDIVLQHPDGEHVIVIAGGQGYIVNPDTRRVTHQFGGAVEHTYSVEEMPLLVFEHQGIAFEAFSQGGRAWRTRRLSWDGFRNVRIEDGRMLGQAWNPMGDSWHEFVVDLATGTSSGGSYD